MTTDELSGQATIPVAELEELVEDFEGYGDNNERKADHGGQIYDGIAIGRRRSALELQNLLKEYKHG